MKSQGLINVASFSLWLNDLNATTGSILFGGVDSTKYTGKPTVVPLLLGSDYEASFAIPWTGLVVSGSNGQTDFSPSTVQTAVLSPGSSATFLPNDTVTSIYNGLGVTIDPNFGSIVPCNLSSTPLNFYFSFGGGSNRATIVVPLSEFVVPIRSSGAPTFGNGQKACYFGILSGGSGPAYFGESFLRSAYVVYDLETVQIGLAQTKFSSNAGTGVVSALSSGGGIPGATVTASSATLGQSVTRQSLTLTTSNSAVSYTSGSLIASSTTSSAAASSSSSTARNGAGQVGNAAGSTFGLFALGLAAMIQW